MKPAIILLALSALAATAPSAIGASRIGVAATVVNNVTGTVGARTSKLASGDAVFQREKISTGSRARTQLLLADQTTFSLGANSNAVLDKFVYDPNRNAGSVALSVTRGAFRFVTGTAKPTSYSVKIPVASIGVRGTIFGCHGISLFFATCTLREGAIIICPVPGARVVPPGKPQENGCTLIDKPGRHTVSLNGDGMPPDGTPPGDPDNNDAIDNGDGTFTPPPPPVNIK